MVTEMEKAKVIFNGGFLVIKEDLKRELKQKENAPLISSVNIRKINAIQELIFLEEDNALTINEVLERILKFYQKFVPYRDN
jgi:hypothetical protein